MHKRMVWNVDVSGASVSGRVAEIRMLDNRYSPEKIHELIEGSHELTKKQEAILAVALSKLPKYVVNYIIVKCLFVSSNSKRWAWYLSYNDLKKMQRAIIFLSDELWKKDINVIENEIIHLAAHVWLDHDSYAANVLSPEERRMREEEVSREVSKWLAGSKFKERIDSIRADNKAENAEKQEKEEGKEEQGEKDREKVN